MNVSRRRACAIIGTVLTLGPATTIARAESSHLTLVDVTLPDTIELGGTFTASVDVENTGSERVSTEVTYQFEGDLIASMDVTIEPGETRTARLPGMEAAWLSENREGELTPGTYRHSIGIQGGPRERREVEVVSGDSTPSGDTPSGQTPAGTPPMGLALIEKRFPETVAPGTPMAVGLVVENVRSTSTTIDITYAFEGREVFFKEAITIEPGERREIGFDEITIAAIEESLGRELEPGTYTHSFGVRDGPRADAQIEVLGKSEGENRDTTAARGEDGPQQSIDGADRQRGFFSNTGDEPEFISNPFNLTTLGFLLSVAGIAHQMLQGR